MAVSGDDPLPGKAAAQVHVAAKSWWMVAALFIIYVFAWLDRLIISMMVEPMKSTLMLTDFQMSIILGPAFAISYAIFGIPLGWASDHYPRRWVIFFGVSLWTFGTMACGFAESYSILLFFRVLVGIGEASLLPAAYSMIADEFPRERLTLATSVFQMAGKVGSATAFGLGGLVIALAQSLQGVNWPIHGVAHSWQIVMVMVGAPGLLFVLLLFTFREPARREPAVPTNLSSAPVKNELFAFIYSHRLLLLLMTISFSCLAIVGYSMTSWVPTFIGRRFGWEPIQYGPALSVMNLFAAASLVVNGRVVDYLFERGMRDVHLRFYSWLILGLSPVILYMFFASNVFVFLAMYGLIQIITVPFMVFVSALIALLAPSSVRGQMLGLFMFVFNIIGFGSGPAIVGALTDFMFKDEARLGSSLAIVVISGCAISLITMRMALRHLDHAIDRSRNAQRPVVVGAG